jgi:hypothetical protein
VIHVSDSSQIRHLQVVSAHKVLGVSLKHRRRLFLWYHDYHVPGVSMHLSAMIHSNMVTIDPHCQTTPYTFPSWKRDETRLWCGQWTRVGLDPLSAGWAETLLLSLGRITAMVSVAMPSQPQARLQFFTGPPSWTCLNRWPNVSNKY